MKSSTSTDPDTIVSGSHTFHLDYPNNRVLWCHPHWPSNPMHGVAACGQQHTHCEATLVLDAFGLELRSGQPPVLETNTQCFSCGRCRTHVFMWKNVAYTVKRAGAVWDEQASTRYTRVKASARSK